MSRNSYTSSVQPQKMKKFLHTLLWMYIGLAPLVAGYSIRKAWVRNQGFDLPRDWVDFRDLDRMQRALDEGLLDCEGLEKAKVRLDGLGMQTWPHIDKETGAPSGLGVSFRSADNPERSTGYVYLGIAGTGELRMEWEEHKWGSPGVPYLDYGE